MYNLSSNNNLSRDLLLNLTMNYLDLLEVRQIAQNDNEKLLRYLNQFNELVPKRVNNLKMALIAEDRLKVNQILHQMHPQLQFFGVPDITIQIHTIEESFETMNFETLKTLVHHIIHQLKHACLENKSMLNKLSD